MRTRVEESWLTSFFFLLDLPIEKEPAIRVQQGHLMARLWGSSFFLLRKHSRNTILIGRLILFIPLKFVMGLSLSWISMWHLLIFVCISKASLETIENHLRDLTSEKMCRHKVTQKCELTYLKKISEVKNNTSLMLGFLWQIGFLIRKRIRERASSEELAFANSSICTRDSQATFLLIFNNDLGSSGQVCPMHKRFLFFLRLLVLSHK